MKAPRTATRIGPQWLSLSDAVSRLAQQFGGADNAQAELDKRIRWGEIAVRAGYLRRIEKYMKGRPAFWCQSSQEYRNRKLHEEDWCDLTVNWRDGTAALTERTLEIEIRDIHISLDDFSRMWAPSVVHEIPTTTTYKTGLPGKPSSKHLILEEFRRRLSASETEASLPDEARYLESWLARQHPTAAQAKAGTIKNHIRHMWNSTAARN